MGEDTKIIIRQYSSPIEERSIPSPPSSPDSGSSYWRPSPSPPCDESDSSCSQTSIASNISNELNETKSTTKLNEEAATSQERQTAPSEYIILDHNMFGTVTDHLMPAVKVSGSSGRVEIQGNSETWKQILHAFTEKYKMEGLPVELDGESATINEEQAFIYPGTRTATFGCKTLPSKLLQKTLQDWIKTPSRLRRLVISTQDKENRSKMEELCQQLPLVKVWSLSEHETSVYRMQDVSAYEEKCKGRDQASIYVLICDDLRIAVMAVSDYALSVSFGGALPKSFTFPLMKFALAEITSCNGFYQIKEKELREQWENVKNNFRQVS